MVSNGRTDFHYLTQNNSNLNSEICTKVEANTVILDPFLQVLNGVSLLSH